MRKQRRKQAKKPLLDSDSDSDSALDSGGSKKQIKHQPNDSKDKKTDNKSPFSFDFDFQIEVKDGINDLAMLPRELIESELITRGFQPDMTRALDTKFLVNTLRGGKFIPKEDTQGDRPFYHSYSYELYQSTAPIFDDTSEEILKKRKIEEDKRIEKEKQEEEEMMENFQSLNPNEFSKDNENNEPSAPNQVNPMGFGFSFLPNYLARKRMNYSLSVNLQNYGIDIDKITNSTPDNDDLIKNMEEDYSKHYSTEDIIFRNIILNSTPKEDDDNDN